MKQLLQEAHAASQAAGQALDASLATKLSSTKLLRDELTAQVSCPCRGQHAGGAKGAALYNAAVQQAAYYPTDTVQEYFSNPLRYKTSCTLLLRLNSCSWAMCKRSEPRQHNSETACGCHCRKNSKCCCCISSVHCYTCVRHRIALCMLCVMCKMLWLEGDHGGQGSSATLLCMAASSVVSQEEECLGGWADGGSNKVICYIVRFVHAGCRCSSLKRAMCCVLRGQMVKLLKTKSSTPLRQRQRSWRQCRRSSRSAWMRRTTR